MLSNDPPQPLTYILYLPVSFWSWLNYDIKTTLRLRLESEDSSQQGLCTDY